MQRGFVKRRGAGWTAFHYAHDQTGRRRQHTKGGFRTKSEAQAHLNAAVAAVQSGDFVEPTKLTFGRYLTERWLPTKQHSLRPSTLDSYRRIIELHVLPMLGNVPLQALSADHLDRLYSQQLQSGCLAGAKTGGGLAIKTVRYIHTTLHGALRDAERKRLVTRNVAASADPPKLRQSGYREMRTWSGGQVGYFLAWMQTNRLGVAYLLAATTGMRRGEVLGLRWRDVDLDAGRLAVRQTIVTVRYELMRGTPKTARGRRSIALDPITVEALRDHRRRQAAEQQLIGVGFADQDLVFCKIDGSPVHPDYFSQLFDRSVAKLDLPRIRLHDLRHTHATLGLAAGTPAKVMADRLGHSTVAFTQDVYMHTIPRLEAEAAAQVAELIFAGPK